MLAHVRLERALEAHHGGYVAACSSGTAALHLALEALPIPRGSEILVPNFTMIACARAAALAGLTPVFVGCREDGLLDPALLRKAAGPRAKAVMAVHLYGRRCDMEAIATLCGELSLFLVEDSAEAFTVPPHPDSDAVCWSFYRNKVVAGEEGGAARFRRKAFADRARKLRCLGFTEEHDFVHIPRGCNYRLADCLAELVLTSLARLPQSVLDRRLAEEHLGSLCQPEQRMPRRDCPWVYDLRVRSEAMPIVRELNEAGIAARRAFQPMNRQPEFRGSVCFPGCEDALARTLLYLPMDIASAKAFPPIRELA